MSVKDAGGSHAFSYALLTLVTLFSVGLCGCSSSSGYIPQKRLTYRDLSALYYQIPLRQSRSLDILRRMKSVQGTVDAKYVEREVITQSDAVIAASGRSVQGRKSWFTLVAFDKYSNTAQRKSFFYLDEKAGRAPLGGKRYLIPSRTVLVYDAAALVGDVLGASHASEQERKIAIVSFLARQLQQDIADLAGEDAQSRNTDMVGVNGMFMNQVFRDAINELRKYPVLTRELHEPNGVAFENMSLPDGRIRLALDNDLATVRIELGFPSDG